MVWNMFSLLPIFSNVYIDINTASSLKQQSLGRQTCSSNLRYYTDSQSTIFCSYFMPSWESANINFMVFGLTRAGITPTIYRTQGKHTYHCITAIVSSNTHNEYGLHFDDFKIIEINMYYHFSMKMHFLLFQCFGYILMYSIWWGIYFISKIVFNT